MGNEANSKLQTLSLPGDCIYNGETEDGKPHGNGCLECKDGYTYQGEFKNGGYHGKGRMEWKRQRPHYIYEGEFADNEITGFGEMLHEVVGIEVSAWCFFRGSYFEGAREGWGYEVCLRAEDYTGEQALRDAHRTIKQGHPHSYYEGNFKNNLYEGQGIGLMPNGDIIRGTWKEGDMHGLIHKKNLTALKTSLNTFVKGELYGR